MLGEDHAIIIEFPEYKEKISELNKTDSNFAEYARRYHALDQEIRQLELDNAPIDDEAMHQLKHDRASLKDVIYQRLKA
ncbi:MAG: YdcH family protein [Marinomonas sp.]|jgi:uncharacterized protein YdcH (DUF465 family)|uniref:YdcH family protein n=1 Tax=Marinomonas sp. TaxID=1904862 RepID=UPI003C73AE90